MNKRPSKAVSVAKNKPAKPDANKVSPLLKMLRTIKQSRPAVFGKLSPQESVAMVRCLFNAIEHALEEIEEGQLLVEGLGRFVVKVGVGENAGKQRIQFHVVSPKKDDDATQDNNQAATAEKTPAKRVAEKANLKANINVKKGAIDMKKEAADKQKSVNKLKLATLVSTAKLENERAFGNVDEKRAMAIMRSIFAEVKKQLETTSEGNIPLPGLGQLVIKQVEVEKEGKTTTKQRIVFRMKKKGKKEKAAN